jgi:argininosuccinate lyase
MDETLWNLSESFSFDRALYRYDIEGSRAHVEGLTKAGLLSVDERNTLLATLDQIEAEFDSESFERGPNDEDVHTETAHRAKS